MASGPQACLGRVGGSAREEPLRCAYHRAAESRYLLE